MANFGIAFVNDDGTPVADATVVHAYVNDSTNTVVETSTIGHSPADPGQGMAFFALLSPNTTYKFALSGLQGFRIVELPSASNIIIPTGIAGDKGDQGNPGKNAFTTVPLGVANADISGSNALIYVADYTAFPVQSFVFISDGANTLFGQVGEQSIAPYSNSNGSVTSANLIFVTGIITSTIGGGPIFIAENSLVVQSGPQGPAGSSGGSSIPSVWGGCTLQLNSGWFSNGQIPFSQGTITSTAPSESLILGFTNGFGGNVHIPGTVDVTVPSDFINGYSNFLIDVDIQFQVQLHSNPFSTDTVINGGLDIRDNGENSIGFWGSQQDSRYESVSEVTTNGAFFPVIFRASAFLPKAALSPFHLAMDLNDLNTSIPSDAFISATITLHVNPIHS